VDLTTRERFALRIQRGASRILSPLWVPLLTAIMRFVMNWRIEGADAVRRQFAQLRRESDSPLLVCANHLTMLDSFVIGWSLGSGSFFLRDFGALPWNTPERVLFASQAWKRALVWLFKCVPVRRGSDRAEVARTLEKIRFLMLRGEVALIFPEGGRSRTGRVQANAAAYGVGRLLRSLPNCRVLCVYLRGRGQETWSNFPKRGERFVVQARVIEPKASHPGLRGSLEMSGQIVTQLARMERGVLDDWQ